MYLLWEKTQEIGINLLPLASLLFLPFLRFLLECLLSSYWAVQEFFYVSLHDLTVFSSNCSLNCLKTVKGFSAKTKTLHEVYFHDINDPLKF